MTQRNKIHHQIRNEIRKLNNKNKQNKFLETLSEQEILTLIHDWWIWARDDQLPPNLINNKNPKNNKNWRTWLILGGRGAGKTRAGAEWVRAQALAKTPIAEQNGAKRIALIGKTITETRSIMIEGISGILNIHPEWEKPTFSPQQKKIFWKNGATAQIFSADEYETLRGPQFDAAWCDELCKWKYPQQCWDMLQFALRLGKNPKTVITTTPRPIKLLKKIIQDETTAITKASTYKNANNLAPEFIKAIKKQYQGTTLGKQEINAEIIEDLKDALWKRNTITQNRVKYPPQLERIVIAIDPPAGHKTKNSQCGIIAAGKAKDQIYILEDKSIGAVMPNIWATRAIELYKKLKADRIVAEINQGGDMVEEIIRRINKNIPFRAVRATRGKIIRAEPIAALYEQGKIAHVGNLPELEDQMCAFTQNTKKQESPDRVDALVWAITDLINPKNQKPIIRRL